MDEFLRKGKTRGGIKNEKHYRRQESQTIAEDPKHVDARDALSTGAGSSSHSKTRKLQGSQR
jgi:hypothetical protein